MSKRGGKTFFWFCFFFSPRNKQRMHFALKSLLQEAQNNLKIFKVNSPICLLECLFFLMFNFFMPWLLNKLISALGHSRSSFKLPNWHRQCWTVKWKKMGKWKNS